MVRDSSIGGSACTSYEFVTAIRPGANIVGAVVLFRAPPRCNRLPPPPCVAILSRLDHKRKVAVQPSRLDCARHPSPPPFANSHFASLSGVPIYSRRARLPVPSIPSLHTRAFQNIQPACPTRSRTNDLEQDLFRLTPNTVRLSRQLRLLTPSVPTCGVRYVSATRFRPFMCVRGKNVLMVPH